MRLSVLVILLTFWLLQSAAVYCTCDLSGTHKPWLLWVFYCRDFHFCKISLPAQPGFTKQPSETRQHNILPSSAPRLDRAGQRRRCSGLPHPCAQHCSLALIKCWIFQSRNAGTRKGQSACLQVPSASLRDPGLGRRKASNTSHSPAPLLPALAATAGTCAKFHFSYFTRKTRRVPERCANPKSPGNIEQT